MCAALLTAFRSECKPSDPGKQGVKQGENKGCKEQWSLLPWLLHTCPRFLSSYSHPLMTNEIQTIHFKEVCTLCLTFPMTYVLKIQKVFFQYGQPALHASLPSALHPSPVRAWVTWGLLSPGSASSSRLFSNGDASCLVLMWMGLNHMVSLLLSLTVLKNLVLSTLAANWSASIVDSHHHQQVIFPLQAWLLVMYRKSKWKCGYDLAVLGHGEFTSAQLVSESQRFFLHPNFHRWKSWRES